MTDIIHKHAIILSGGGAYGAYEVGVIKALFTGKSAATGYTPLDPDICTGTSIGAINASILLSRPEMDSFQMAKHLESVWLNKIVENPQNCGNGLYRLRGNPLPYLNPECVNAHPATPFVALASDTAALARYWIERGTNFLQSSDTVGQRAVDLIEISALFSQEPSEQLLMDTISFDALHNSDKVLKIISTNWKTGAVRIFGNQDMTGDMGPQALMASFALPGIFPPVEIAGEPYVDGSLGMNTPVLPAIEAGAERVYIVFVDPLVKNITIEEFPSTADTIFRTQMIQWAIKSEADIRTARKINWGLETLEEAAGAANLPGGRMRHLVQAEGQTQRRVGKGSEYRKLTIHVFRPQSGPAEALRALNLSRDRALDLIELGYNETVSHDCAANGCVLAKSNG